MGFACRGITHCDKCEISLSMDEFGICNSCKRKEEMDKEQKIDKIIHYFESLTNDEINGIQEFIERIEKQYQYKRLRKERENIDKQIKNIRRK